MVGLEQYMGLDSRDTKQLTSENFDGTCRDEKKVIFEKGCWNSNVVAQYLWVSNLEPLLLNWS